MPYIRVNPNALGSISDTLRTSSNKIGRIESDFSGVARKLDWDVRSASDIQRRIDRISSELEDQAQKLDKMRLFIIEAKKKYKEVQKDDKELEEYYLKRISGEMKSAKPESLVEAEELERRKKVANLWNWVAVGVCVVGCIAVSIATGGAAVPMIIASTAAGALTSGVHNITDQYVEDGFEDGFDYASFGKDVAVGSITGLASGVLGSGVSSYVSTHLTPYVSMHLSSNVVVNSVLHSSPAIQRIGTSVVVGSISDISSGIVVRGTTELIQTGDIQSAFESAADIKQILLDGTIGGISGGVAELSSIKKAQNAADAAAQKYNLGQKSTPLADGERAGLVNLKQTPNGGVSFSESDYILRVPNGDPVQVKIQATQSRAKDYAAAEKALKEQGINIDFKSMRTGNQKTHVWHHLDDYNVLTNEITLEFIDIKAHDAINTHAGSAKQFQVANGYGYSKKASDVSMFKGINIKDYLDPVREYTTEGLKKQAEISRTGK